MITLTIIEATTGYGTRSDDKVLFAVEVPDEILLPLISNIASIIHHAKAGDDPQPEPPKQ